MGYDFNRVSGFGKNHLKCNICLDVAKDAVQLLRCEHLFCKQCICQWVRANRNCPVDRIRAYESHIKNPSNIIRTILNKLEITCEFAAFGCDFVSTLNRIDSHQQTCEYNGERTVKCERGCGADLTIREINTHSCVQVLKQRLDFIEYELLQFICGASRKKAKHDHSDHM